MAKEARRLDEWPYKAKTSKIPISLHIAQTIGHVAGGSQLWVRALEGA